MWHILTLFFPRIQCDMKFHNCHQAIVHFQSCSLEEGPPTYRNDTQYITLNMRKNSGNSSKNRMSNLACDMSSRCFFLVKPRNVAFLSSILPLRANAAPPSPRATEGDFLGNRGVPRVVPILILSNKPAYSINAPNTNRTQTMTQASIAERE